MNLERLRWGEWIAAIAALNLLLVTFRSWYKVTGTDVHVTAWDALDTGRYLLLATAAVGIFLWLYQAAEDRGRLEIPMGWVAAVIGLACTIYIAYRLATPPADALDPDIGLYLGLVSALGVAIGGLLSAREPEAYTSSYATPDETAAPVGEPESAGADTWSPAAPAASTSGWSPAAPAAPLPPATPAGAVGTGDLPLQAGDSVVLTAGGARFPAGTVARVVEAFAGGALVEVTAPDGMAERFEVPDSAYERAPAGGAAVAGESWSPAMPAAAGEDWGFDESPAAAAAGAGAATGLGEPEAEKPKKTPWWKREIGGGKKKDDDEGLGFAGAAAAGAAGAAAVEAGSNGAGEEKPGFFKRIFGGGGSKDEPDTEALEGESTPASDVAGIGQAAESDTAVAETAVDEPPAAFSEPEPPLTPEPEPLATEPDAAPAAAAEPEVAPITSEPEPAPAASEPEAAPAASEPEAAPAASEPEVAPIASEPEPPAPEPEPPAAEPEAAAADPAPEPPAPEPDASEPDISATEAAAGLGAAGAGAAAATAAASGGDAEEKPKRKRSSGSRKVPEEAIEASGGDAEEKPRRKRSSGSRKVPQEAVAAAAGGAEQPKVGDQVQLKVGGGKYDAGTQGTVVDVFSAGVIVELSDAEGRTERLDLPFEAIGPADA